MAGFFTEHASNAALDLFFGGRRHEPTTLLYVGLSTGPASRRASYAEPEGGGYARAALENSGANFPGASGGMKANARAIAFPAPTADWGTIASVFVADAPLGGNVLAMADLARPRAVVAGGRPPTIAAGSLAFSHS